MYRLRNVKAIKTEPTVKTTCSIRHTIFLLHEHRNMKNICQLHYRRQRRRIEYPTFICCQCSWNAITEEMSRHDRTENADKKMGAGTRLKTTKEAVNNETFRNKNETKQQQQHKKRKKRKKGRKEERKKERKKGRHNEYQTKRWPQRSQTCMSTQ